MQSSIFKFLPLIFTVLVVVGAVAFASQKFLAKKKIEGVFTKLPEPTPFIPVKPFRADSGVVLTPTPTPSATPTPTPPVAKNKKVSPGMVAPTNVGDSSQVKLAVKTETICTPVYGMANFCAEHLVVDTGLETGALYNLAALSYFGGLAAFIKSKRG